MTKKDYLCVEHGCQCRAEQDNYRCLDHSLAYYGGQRLSGGDRSRTPRVTAEDIERRMCE